MRYSQTLIPTLKEVPAEAEVVSHQLMVRAGFIRKLASGIYIYLPLALKVLRKIEQIIREEMNAAGASELLLPIVMPAELWMETGRWDYYGKELLRFKDRHDRDFCIGPTHEEAITHLVTREVKSYRDLPKNLFQIQTKFRDEVRPRFGLMRGREFIMKDGYSFDTNIENAHISYKKMFDAYTKIFTRCGLEFRPVEAATGAIGGTLSHEFQVLADSGEDAIFFCDKCGYAANYEKARTISTDELEKMNKELGKAKPHKKYSEVSTPDKKSVEDVSAFLKIDPSALIKTIIYKVTVTTSNVIPAQAGIQNSTKALDSRLPSKQPAGRRGNDKTVVAHQIYVAVLALGSDEIIDAKVKQALFDGKIIETLDVQLEMADEAAVKQLTKAPVGFAGPVGISDEVKIIADTAVFGKSGLVAGANKSDTHLKNVSWEDCGIEFFADIRRASAGLPCAVTKCKGTLNERRGIEVGQVFYLGTKYSEQMKTTYLDENGKEQVMVMGCYGIGVSRTAAASIEQNHDANGIIWPINIAPAHCHLIVLYGKDDRVAKMAEDAYCKLMDSGIEVLFDDRDERAGVKFADADLIGVPFQIIVGSKSLEDGTLEVKERRSGEKSRLTLEEVIKKLKGELRNGGAKEA